MLRDFVETDLSAEEIGDLLTMTGFELEEITEVEGEPVLNVNIMANRGDGASVFGMAREVLAKDTNAKATDLYQRALNRFPAEPGDEVNQKAKVTIQTENCHRFAARVYEDVENGPSPEWLQQRLRQIGQRPISLLVDLTNYVMFELGQPLHSFDLDKLGGQQIVVRQAEEGEKMTTLDGTEHELQPHYMMICDAERPVGVAGVMGGEDTEVSASTKRCLLETAHFDHQSVRKTRKDMGLFTEASYRFERYVDPEAVVAAQGRFAELYEQITGKKPVAGMIDHYVRQPERTTVHVRMDRCNKILHMTVDPAEARGYLQRLGFELGEGASEFDVTAPTWRIDIQREEDVIEEIGRIHGYEKIPSLAPIGSTPQGGVQGREAFIDRLREETVRCGLTQIVSHTLGDLHPLDAPHEKTRVRTPHSPEMAYLRNSLLPGICQAALKNGAANLMLFETGQAFTQNGEWTHLGILCTGETHGSSWENKQPETSSFFSVKGIIERIAKAEHRTLTFEAMEDKRLHPTRQAAIKCGGEVFGFIGQIHPDVAEELDLPGSTILAEIDLDRLWKCPADELALKQISSFPAIRRDIAILIDEAVPYAELEAQVRQSAGDVLERQWLFDLYKGKGVPEGKQSLALALQLRKADGTFTDEEANQVRDRVVAALESLGAQLR